MWSILNHHASVGRPVLGPPGPSSRRMTPATEKHRPMRAMRPFPFLEEGSVKHGEITSGQDQEFEDRVPGEDGQPQ